MPPRPAPDTPFTEEDLARLPQWAQRKVTWLSGQLARALELAGQADRDTPTESATERADADSLANAGRRALAKALTSPEVKAFIEQKYKGAVVPAF